MSKSSLLTGVAGIIIGALGMYTFTASAPSQHEISGMPGMQADPMSMTMDDMAVMLEGKNGDAFDQAFLEGMIPHHQGAIDMAVAAKARAGHAEIKAMADAIIEAQQREIDMMRSWQESWGFTQ